MSAARGDDSKVRENDKRIVDGMLEHTRPASDAAYLDDLAQRRPALMPVMLVVQRVHRWRFLTPGRKAELILLLDEARQEIEKLETERHA